MTHLTLLEVVHYYLHPIYGIYQTAYGYTIGQNGTINVPGMPGTFITAPPGMTVGGSKDNTGT